MPTGLILIMIFIVIVAVYQWRNKPEVLTQEQAEDRKNKLMDEWDAKRPQIPINGIINDKGLYEDRMSILNDIEVSTYYDDFTGMKGAKITKIAGKENNWFLLYSRINNTHKAEMNVFGMSFHFLNGVMYLQFNIVTGDHFTLSQQESIKIKFKNGSVLDVSFFLPTLSQSGHLFNQVEISPVIFKMFTENQIEKIRFENLPTGYYCIVDFDFDISGWYINKGEIQYEIQAVAVSFASVLAS